MELDGDCLRYPNQTNCILSTLGPSGETSGTTNSTNDGAKGIEGPTSVSFSEVYLGKIQPWPF